jgi:hypothetical protein
MYSARARAIDQVEPEDRAQQQDPTSTSHTNQFDISMTIALVQHLVRQVLYTPDDIAVIIPCLGQLHYLRRERQDLFQISVGDIDARPRGPGYHQGGLRWRLWRGGHEAADPRPKLHS